MSLELIIGPMFAGKSSTIMSIVKRYEAIRYPIIVLTHVLDNRYSNVSEIVNHDFQRMKANALQELLPIFTHPSYINAKVIVIEEGQFFHDLYEFVVRAVDNDGKHVIVAGLDGDSDRKPFGQILNLVPLADNIQKITSFCNMCSDGTAALFTYCTASKKQQVHVGSVDKYMPLCRSHYLELSSSTITNQ